MDEIFEEIFEFVKTLEIIDTHEHLPPKENLRDKKTDILKEYLMHYLNSDLISAGLSKKDLQKIIDIRKPIKQRWKILEPYWKFVRYTGYGRALEISINELYGVKEFSEKTIEELNKKFKLSLKSGHWEKVLKEKSKIKISILDNCVFETFKPVVNCDKNLFRNMLRLDNFIYPDSKKGFEQIEKYSNVKIKSFKDWLRACEIFLEKGIKSNIVALKSGLAYERSLKYEKVKKSEAEDIFNKFIKDKSTFPIKIIENGRKLQDFMMHYVLNLANKRNMVVQFHTGIQEGNGNIISNSDPSLLSNLFLEYPNVKFDILHIGYPYQNILAVLAKTFPNVYIDMCWAHIISPNASVNALVEFIDTVPINKISAFGGDFCFIDGVYGHQYLARINVSKALTIKVKEGVLNIEESKKIAERIFFKNPNELFKLNL